MTILVQDLMGCGHHCWALSHFHVPSHHCWPHPLKSRYFGAILLLFHGNLLEVSPDVFQGCSGSCCAPLARRPLLIYVCNSVSSTRNTRWDEILDFPFSWKHKYCRDKHLCWPCWASGLCGSAVAHVHRPVRSRAHNWCRSLVGLFVRFISWQQSDCPHRHTWRIIVQFSVEPSPQTPSH